MMMGFYDESLLLSRSIGEIANLLFLFATDKPSFERWKRAPRQQRLQNFSPLKIRLAIEATGATPPIGADRYAGLSEISAHVHPKTSPQAHNVLALPMPGGIYQEAGFLVCLNELALGISVTAAFSALLLTLEKPVRRNIVARAKNLAEHLGGADVMAIDDYYAALHADPNSSEKLRRAQDELREAQRKRRWRVH